MKTTLCFHHKATDKHTDITQAGNKGYGPDEHPEYPIT